MYYESIMSAVVLAEVEYKKLKAQADAYNRLLFSLCENIFMPPPTRSVAKVVQELKKTKRYSPQFIASVAKGLRHSSYFRK